MPTAPNEASASPALAMVRIVCASMVFIFSPTCRLPPDNSSPAAAAFSPRRPLALSPLSNSPAVCNRPWSFTDSNTCFPDETTAPRASKKPPSLSSACISSGSCEESGISTTVPSFPADSSSKNGITSPVAASTPNPLATPSPCNKFTPVVPAMNITAPLSSLSCSLANNAAPAVSPRSSAPASGSAVGNAKASVIPTSVDSPEIGSITVTGFSETRVRASSLSGSPFSSKSCPGSTTAVPSAFIVISGGMIFTVLPSESVTRVACGPSNESEKLVRAPSSAPSRATASSPARASTAVCTSMPNSDSTLSSPGSAASASAMSAAAITVGAVSASAPSLAAFSTTAIFFSAMAPTAPLSRPCSTAVANPDSAAVSMPALPCAVTTLMATTCCSISASCPGSSAISAACSEDIKFIAAPVSPASISKNMASNSPVSEFCAVAPATTLPSSRLICAGSSALPAFTTKEVPVTEKTPVGISTKKDESSPASGPFTSKAASPSGTSTYA